MQIADVRVLQLEGVLEHDGPFWEERLIRPVDIYPEHKHETRENMLEQTPGRLRLQPCFLEIEADTGEVGIGGPFGETEGRIILSSFRPLLMGQDPLAIERIWDRLYRSAVHGRKGVEMMALSVVDCALWDLKGIHFNAPVCSLLGGPVRTEVPAYASALGYSLEPDLVAERVRMIADLGYRATKWFFRHGPHDGREGRRLNLELVRTLRETAGPDIDIMLDCWMSWDVPYAIDMSRRLEEYQPRWLEEPVLPDKVDQYAQIRAESRIPISGGEHEYTRWGLHQLMQKRACDVLQPDIYWAGGISEMMKICALASAYDLPVIPHGHSTPASIHLIAAWPVATCPMLEYLIKWNAVHQFFLKHPVHPQGGIVSVPDTPGLGMELDRDKADRVTVLG